MTGKALKVLSQYPFLWCEYGLAGVSTVRVFHTGRDEGVDTFLIRLLRKEDAERALWVLTQWTERRWPLLEESSVRFNLDG